jgi:rRNA maturation RNase YbeY
MDNRILIKHPANWGLEEDMVKSLTQRALKKRGYMDKTEVSLVFVGRKAAKGYNMKYRQKEYIPQVLGFPMSKDRDVDGYIRLGDIMICTQKLKYEVKFQRSTIEKVLEDWLLHGVDNLLKE